MQYRCGVDDPNEVVKLALFARHVEAETRGAISFAGIQVLC